LPEETWDRGNVLLLDAPDRLNSGRYGVATPLGQHDEFRAAVVRVGTEHTLPTPEHVGEASPRDSARPS
jgi:hypothetical protein